MFGNASEPSINFTYFAKQPTENLDVALRQLRLANQYRSNLVAIELERRQRTDAALAELFPDLKQVETELAAAEVAVEELLAAASAKNASAKKLIMTPAVKAEIKTAKERRKSLYDQRKAIRRESFQSPAWVSRQEEITTEDKRRRIEARENCNLYWGTYLTIEQSMSDCRSGAPPELKRFSGDGSLAVQLQGGMSIAEAFAGDDTRLRIGKPAEYDENGQPLGRCRRNWTTVSIRVGSSGRAPIWCTVPVKLHRPFPEGSRIKWVFLHCRQHGLKVEWSVRFVLSRASGWGQESPPMSGILGVDVGWRLVKGGLRVAYWADDSGNEGQLVLPDVRQDGDWRYLLNKAEDLAAIRDVLFNAARDKFADWVKLNSACLPELAVEFEHVRQWRSKTRFGRAIEKALGAVSVVDAAQADALTTWWAKERHLQRWQLDNMRKWERRREAIYREFAAVMSRKYRRLIMKDFDLRATQKNKSVENKSAIDAAMKRHQRDAAVSVLREFMKEKFVESEFVSSPNLNCCHVCHNPCQIDGADAMHTCENCGLTWDHDANVAFNLSAGIASAPVA